MDLESFSLLLVIIVLLIERYFYAKEMNSQIRDFQKAIISKNVNEYIAAKTVDSKKEEKYTTPEEIPLNELSDKDFQDVIKNMNK